MKVVRFTLLNISARYLAILISIIMKPFTLTGKVWSVSWDLAACGFPVNPSSKAVFSARYDRAYVSLGWMNQRQQQRQVASRSSSPQALVAVSDLGVGSVQEGCLGVGGCLPNSHHPSDHLPIALAIRL